MPVGQLNPLFGVSHQIVSPGDFSVLEPFDKLLPLAEDAIEIRNALSTYTMFADRLKRHVEGHVARTGDATLTSLARIQSGKQCIELIKHTKMDDIPIVHESSLPPAEDDTPTPMNGQDNHEYVPHPDGPCECGGWRLDGKLIHGVLSEQPEKIALILFPRLNEWVPFSELMGRDDDTPFEIDDDKDTVDQGLKRLRTGLKKSGIPYTLTIKKSRGKVLMKPQTASVPLQ